MLKNLCCIVGVISSVLSLTFASAQGASPENQSEGLHVANFTDVENNVIIKPLFKIKSVLIPEEGLTDEEKQYLEKLRQIVDVVSKARNVDELLNECDQYSDVFPEATNKSEGFYAVQFNDLIYSSDRAKKTDSCWLFHFNGVILLFRNSEEDKVFETNETWKDNATTRIILLENDKTNFPYLSFHSNGMLHNLRYGVVEPSQLNSLNPTTIFQVLLPERTSVKELEWDETGRLIKNEILKEPTQRSKATKLGL